MEELVATDALEGSLLEDPEQLELEVGFRRADLVEEESAAPGDLEPAFLAPVGAGERALLVAEEFAFEELFGLRCL